MKITAAAIGNALGLTGVCLINNLDTGVRITANEPVTEAMQDQVRRWWSAGEVNSVPKEVGSGQIRAALVARGWITLTSPSNADSEVDAWAAGLIELAVSDPAQKAIAHLLWKNASGFKRDNQFVLMVAATLGKTSEEIDDLFRTAATF